MKELGVVRHLNVRNLWELTKNLGVSIAVISALTIWANITLSKTEISNLNLLSILL